MDRKQYIKDKVNEKTEIKINKLQLKNLKIFMHELKKNGWKHPTK